MSDDPFDKSPEEMGAMSNAELMLYLAPQSGAPEEEQALARARQEAMVTELAWQDIGKMLNAGTRFYQHNAQAVAAANLLAECVFLDEANELSADLQRRAILRVLELADSLPQEQRNTLLPLIHYKAEIAEEAEGLLDPVRNARGLQALFRDAQYLKKPPVTLETIAGNRAEFYAAAPVNTRRDEFYAAAAMKARREARLKDMENNGTDEQKAERAQRRQENAAFKLKANPLSAILNINGEEIPDSDFLALFDRASGDAESRKRAAQRFDMVAPATCGLPFETPEHAWEAYGRIEEMIERNGPGQPGRDAKIFKAASALLQALKEREVELRTVSRSVR